MIVNKLDTAMIVIKNVLGYIYIIIAVLSFSCKSFEPKSEDDSLINKAYLVRTTDTTESSFKEFSLCIEINKNISPSIQLDSVYFKNLATTLNTAADSKILYIGLFKFDLLANNLILSSDRNQEFTNKLPHIFKIPPIQLENHQALLSYTDNGKRKYEIIDSIKERNLTQK